MSGQAIVAALTKSGQTLCTAESLTGGLAAAAICGVPGASGCFQGGVVAYQDEVKIAQLSVDPHVIERHSAVSAACARQMAKGALDKFKTDFALSTTGYAGPTGENVGLVFLGLATKGRTAVHRLHLRGSRQGIRKMTVQLALYFLQKEIERYGQGKEHQEGR